MLTISSKRYLALGSFILAFGCSGQTTSGADGVLTKLQAAEGQGEGDICATQNWYGDKQCDTFCERADTDCETAPGKPIVCAAFVEEQDGKCTRKPTDPCRAQDPDCGQDPTKPIDGVVCAMLSEVSDGKCSRESSDPCTFQDPDCSGSACPEFVEVSDGKCSRAPDDLCRSQDPDCVVACTMMALAPDGVCRPVAPGPCSMPDPDCYTCKAATGGAAMMPAPISDEICTPPLVGACGVVMEDPDCNVICQKPVAAPISDGICTTSTDPCLADPDCNVACAAYSEVSDGKCSRPATDPCISQDPDCVVPTPAPMPAPLPI